jgi:O-antigen/teichoic acid export membrane protein
VLYPVLAGLKESPEAVSRIYFKAVMGISYLAFPSMFIASALSDLWVPLLFRGDFPYLADLIKVLAVVGAFQATTSVVGILFLISDRTDALLKSALLLLLVLAGGFVVGGLSGDINVFALVYASLYVAVIFPLSNLIAFRVTGLRMGSLVRAILPSLAGALVGAAASWLVADWLVHQSSAVRLGAALTSGVVVYLAAIQMLSGRGPSQNVAYCWTLVREARH